MISELATKIKDLETRLNELRGYLDLDGKIARLKHLERAMAKKSFWDNADTATRLLKEKATLSETVEGWHKKNQELEESKILLKLAEEEGDLETAQEIDVKLRVLENEITEMELKNVMQEETDRNPAIVTIHSGAGGTEAQDWAEMLLRMYLKWAEKRGFKAQIIDLMPGDEAGIKSVTFTLDGDYAYGLLKNESGIHRLIRISPFDAGRRRHTSFASVFVYPEIDKTITVDIRDSDLRIDTYRASGAGGQHVNKTSSAVRITHLPTGIVVQCQSERSQHRNKETAMKVLKSRLYQLEKTREAEKMRQIYESKAEIAWGSQIRSYVMQPYRMVKDHRTNLEVGNVDAILNGEIDAFIRTSLLSRSSNIKMRDVFKDKGHETTKARRV
ncbi:MAG TPA: peptide chain release factor 2 [Syntrophaceae bacterium]|nr:peptide chain release factor 2 [Syntrophaceae bacterium]